MAETKFKVGDTVQIVEDDDDPEVVGSIAHVLNPNDYYEWEGYPVSILMEDGSVRWAKESELERTEGEFLYTYEDYGPEDDGREDEDKAIDPDHYKFPGGVEVISISEHLTSNGGQAVQYIARATRLDGKIKGSAVEDLKKSVWFLNREIKRLEAL